MSAFGLITGGIMCAASCYAGVKIKRVYSSRSRFFYEFRDFLGDLKGGIVIYKKPLTELISDYTSGRDGAFIDFLKECDACIRNGTREAISLKRPAFLPHKYFKDVESFFKEVGKSGIDEQQRLIEYHFNKAEQTGDALKKLSQKDGTMYFKLLILLGVTIMIIAV